ncbi:MAG: oxygen-independent coproporphyrinogen III oxidase [Pseudomonadota bacterium]
MKIISEADMVKRLSAPVPRYTSYPTAPHFHDGVSEEDYRNWLATLPEDEGLSLYVHIPFCDRMCWFCGCHTKQINRYDPIPPYLSAVRQEIALLRDAIGFSPLLNRVHLGGGSPSMLKRDDLERLRRTIDSNFQLHDATEISIEIDPSDLSGEEFEAYGAFGITRASIGVQDFDERVQKAINRPQTFLQTAATVEGLRGVGVRSLNIDALYGLPYQSEETVSRSIEQVRTLEPDRVALFGYAHVPWMKPNQKLIPEAALPDAFARVRQATVASDILQDGGYLPIGMDHFALPQDSLAIAAGEGLLRRNFQGYTDDPCATLLGLGTSSIGRLPAGYVQNEPATGNYVRAVAAGQLPVSRGIELTAEDKLHADIIENLMCRYSFSLSALRRDHGSATDQLRTEILDALDADPHDLAGFDGDTFWIHPHGHGFVRTVASWFDTRMKQKAARYSMAV